MMMFKSHGCQLVVGLWLLLLAQAKRSSPPEASSTALKVHRLYTLQPPHDIEMYSVLRVSPNATAAQITQSYRRLSRNYHPDKQQQASSSTASKQTQKENLERVQQAYEILKDDTTRLLYHKYGMSDSNLAVILLFGPRRPHHLSKLDAVHYELLQLMGLDDNDHDNDEQQPQPQRIHNEMDDDDEASSWKNKRRVRLIAARLVELLRPIVEGVVDKNMVGHHLAQDCDRWKTLPMGAQIVRCVGRAYRHAGQDVLKRRHPSTPVRRRWRKAKGFGNAVWASGRATVMEQIWTRQERKLQTKKRAGKANDPTSSIEYYRDSLNELDFLVDDENDNYYSEDDDISLESQEEVQLSEQLKARQTLLQALQVEALWQITKIDLDKAVRQACDMILSGEYFFFPSHQSADPNEWNRGGHGWVGSSGRVVHADQAMVEAAEALVFLGNIMVQRSKEGTAWKE
jgi:hypothetical protein